MRPDPFINILFIFNSSEQEIGLVINFKIYDPKMLKSMTRMFVFYDEEEQHCILF